MSAFIPAPWAIIAGPGHDGSHRYQIVAGQEVIADIVNGPLKGAHAALVSASPDMFKALEDMLVDALFHNVWPADHFCIRQAKAAITKAVTLP